MPPKQHGDHRHQSHQRSEDSARPRGAGGFGSRGGAGGASATAPPVDGPPTHVMIVNDGTAAAGAASGASQAPPDAKRVDTTKVFSPETHPELARDLRAGTHVVCNLHVVNWTGEAAFGRGAWGTSPDVVIDLDADTPVTFAGDTVLLKLSNWSLWQAVKTADPGDEEPHPDAKGPSSAGGRQQVAPARPVLAAAPASSAAATGDGLELLPDGREIVHAIKHKPLADGQDATKVSPARRITEALGAPLNAPAAFRWPAGLQPRATIVSVLERHYESTHACRFSSMEADGITPVRNLRADRWYRFKPYNKAFPILAVFGSDVPSHLRESPADYLHLVEIIADPTTGNTTQIDRRFPKGRVIQSLGKSGTADGESQAIAAMFEVKSTPFSEEVEACVMQDFVVPPPEVLKEMNRRDLRETEFVCTIDPATARDLDDAISIQRLPGGGYRVGVHIADVSHFVPIGSALDHEAQMRATSVYFVERVVPMLPHKLCEDYCSLNAGVDKFAFSGLWTFDRDGKLITESEWFGQSVIRNRCRMAYEDAQRIIEGDVSGDSLKFVNETQPREVLVKRVVESVQTMFELASKLRDARKARGAIALNKAKLKFLFEDMNSRLAPIGFTVERSREANWTVEEFMLLANFRVAEKVVQFLPDSALLRRHDPPKPAKMMQLAKTARLAHIDIGTGSSKALADSLDRLAASGHPDIDAIRTMATLCMQQAKYICTQDAILEAEEEGPKADATEEMKRQLELIENPFAGSKFGHYALAAFAYCHFTSPIRRYADLVTHRQLLLALDVQQQLRAQRAADPHQQADIDPTQLPHGAYYMHPHDVSEIATRCNMKKENARKAGDASIQLFLCLYMDAQRLKRQFASQPPPTGEGAAAAAGPTIAPLIAPLGNVLSPPRIVVLYAVCVRVKSGTFNLNAPVIGLDCEIFHNTKSQLWKEPNKFNEADLTFEINWGVPPGSKAGALPLVEKASLFSKFVVTLRVITQGFMKTDMLIHPPWDRDPSLITPLQNTL